MPINQDVTAPSVSPYIELFKVDLSTIPGLTTIYYLTPSSNTSVIWSGNTYTPWAIQLEGLEANADGSPPRPTLSIGNLDLAKVFGVQVFANSDLIGAEVSYIRTLDSYLNTAISLPPVTMTIGRKMSHNSQVIQFEMRFFNDKERGYLPDRQMLKSAFPGLGTGRR
jgi:lambda family phage minor tail protein L